MKLLAVIAAAFLTADAIVDDDVLEQSVQNEVDHALSKASGSLETAPIDETWRLYCTTNDVFSTNGLSKTAIAIRLVSLQKNDGHWYVQTNDVTFVAVDILQNL